MNVYNHIEERISKDRINNLSPGISHQPWLNLLLTGFVSPPILIFRHTVSSTRPELERSIQLDLTSLSSLQQCDLQSEYIQNQFITSQLPVAWPSSPGHRPCLPSPMLSPGQPDQQTATSLLETFRAAANLQINWLPGK